MKLKDLILMSDGYDLPISGGSGNSKDNPIIIHREEPNDYVGVEYTVLRCIINGRKVEAKMAGQTLLSHNGRKLDKMRVEIVDGPGKSHIECYYFDITECFGN